MKNRFSQLQDLVIQYKDTHSKILRDNIIRALFDTLSKTGKIQARGLTEIEVDEFILSLFEPAGTESKSAFENSLEKYDHSHGAKFFSYFFNIVIKRLNTYCRQKTEENRRTVYRDKHDYELDEADDTTRENILDSILADEITPLFFESAMAIKNEKYRNIFTFSVFFPHELTRKEAGRLFGIEDSAVNSYFKRGLEQFTDNLNEKFSKLGIQMDFETLKALQNSKDFYIKISKNDYSGKEWSIIESRFFKGISQEEICQKLNTSVEEIRKIEHTAVTGFINSFSEKHKSYIDKYRNGEIDMGYYTEIKSFLNGTQNIDVYRDLTELSSKEIVCLEMIKSVFPTESQMLKRGIDKAFSRLNENQIEEFCKNQKTTPSELALVIEEPGSNLQLFSGLTSWLSLKKENKTMTAEDIIRKMDLSDLNG